MTAFRVGVIAGVMLAMVIGLLLGGATVTFWEKLMFEAVMAGIAALIFVVVMRDKEEREHYRETDDE